MKEIAMDGPQAETGLITDDWLGAIHNKISSHPSILRPSAGKPECCIFRVPRTLREINKSAYSPRFVSIGPYHFKDQNLAMFQQHKYRYLGAVLARHKQSPLSLESLARSLEPTIWKAFDFYSESISLSDNDFLEMLVVDSVFLIELFMRSAEKVPCNLDDPIFTMTCVLSSFCSDFLCLENQIPYFILEKIYNEVTPTDDKSVSSLNSLALEFFTESLNLTRKVTDTGAPLHLLDLVRAAFLPVPDEKSRPRVPTGCMSSCVSRLRSAGILRPPKDKDKTVLPLRGRMIQCVSKLRRVGIHLRPPKDKDKDKDKDKTFLSVHFNAEKGLLEMPMIVMDDLMTVFLMNCIAYEQCHSEISKHFTTYTTLLDCLVNTERDVSYMCDKGIVDNWLGGDKEVASLINKMGKEVAVDIDTCYLSEEFKSVENYCNSRWH